jgi:hypothetical protein
MDDALTRLDSWLLLFTLGAGFYYLIWKQRLLPWLRQLHLPIREVARAVWGIGRAILQQMIWVEQVEATPQERPQRRTVRSVRPHPRQRKALPRRSPTGTKLPGSNDGFRASGRDVTPSLPVTSLPNDVTVSLAEVALIAARLTQGMAPSDVAKSLPGYSPKKNYQEYMGKVRQVKATLEAAQPKAGDDLSYRPLGEEVPG